MSEQKYGTGHAKTIIKIWLPHTEARLLFSLQHTSPGSARSAYALAGSNSSGLQLAFELTMFRLPPVSGRSDKRAARPGNCPSFRPWGPRRGLDRDPHEGFRLPSLMAAVSAGRIGVEAFLRSQDVVCS
ncbi:hypothetical protein PoB_006455100 [Plakobranchus ocellatus]|uniref:Uncharacterized protein n=1 Tax=Plakobranchus ocellatus TaxID=259542 RepID=A0AAV4D1S8_9GAST|nr:hypothetical protein PoB_006455100 [Plakobranchus ocellatus]